MGNFHVARVASAGVIVRDNVRTHG